MSNQPMVAGDDQPMVAGDDQPPISPYRSSAQRAAVTVALLGASALVAGAQLVLAAVGLLYVERLKTGSVTAAEVAPFVMFSDATAILGLAVSLATALAYLAWLSRAVDNVPALGGGRPPSTPRWAIAWWFIPFANLGMPYEVVRDLRARMRGDPHLSHAPLLVAWWFTFILGQVVAIAFTQASMETTAQISAGLDVALVAQALTASAGILAILVVRDIEAAARQRAARIAAGESVWSGLSSDAETAAKRQVGWRMRPSWVGFVAVTAALVIPLALGAWVESAGASPVGATSATVSPASSPSQSPGSRSASPSASALASPEADSCAPGAEPGAALPHGAPELETLLPTNVDGRRLEVWSMSGSCWLGMAFTTEAALTEFTAIVDELAVDVDDLRVALAGRSNTETDPPYFVYVLSIPDDPDAHDVAAYLLLGMLVGPENVQAYAEMEYETATLGGKEVLIGSIDLVPQNEHQRGRPYEYVTGDYSYLVLTDDQAWAEDALRQLQ